MDGKRVTTINLSRLTTVADVKLKIKPLFDMEPSRQKLYYRGKHLEDEYKLFDYNVKLNDVLQVVETPKASSVDLRKSAVEDSSTSTEEKKTEAMTTTSAEKSNTYVSCLASEHFKIGDQVDCREEVYGAWFEGRIVNILKSDQANKDDYVYRVLFAESAGYDAPVEMKAADIRPRAKHHLSWADLAVGDTVLVNCNLEDEASRGYWYDMEIKAMEKHPKGKDALHGTLYVGRDKVALMQMKAQFRFGVMKIEETQLLADTAGSSVLQEEIAQRQNGPLCRHCKDNPRRKCKQCGCHVCGGKENPEKQLMCDECDLPYHIGCLSPPLEAIPEVDDWYCPECKNDENEIVKTGEKLKESKRKSKLPSSQSNSSRDWGSGMATMGRSKECTIVPADHFGPIPGIEVGTCWKFRLQASEDGVHRPPVSGIHGRESNGAYSIVLSGGYEDDVDNGDEFMYTGSGGRDLSGNKRTAEQSSDQELTRFNMAIAVNCDAPINKEKGAEAIDWKKGKPIRVVRNYKLSKHSKYAPTEGNRYDGIYKVTKYYPEKGKSGFIVWRFALRRDDRAPAPWTAKGKKRIADLGIEMIYPEGYLEAEKIKEAEKLEKSLTKGKGKASTNSPATKKSSKRPLSEVTSQSPSSKKAKLSTYKLEDDLCALIDSDCNSKLWDSCKEALADGKPKFIAKVAEVFMCICCQELVHQPITTDCKHNICKVCLSSSFAADVFTCPNCRNDFGKEYKMTVNTTLSRILLELFPGYQVGR